MAPNMTPSPKKSFNWGRFSKTLSFWILVILIPIAFLTYGNGREAQAPEVNYSFYRQQLEIAARFFDQLCLQSALLVDPTLRNIGRLSK